MSISFILIIVHASLNSTYELPCCSSTNYVLNSQRFASLYTRKNSHTSVSGEQYPSQPLKVHISTVTHSNLDGHVDLADTYSQQNQV